MTAITLPTGPAYLDIPAYHGDTLTVSMAASGTGLDMTGHTPLLQVRDDSGNLIKNWSSYVTVASATQIDIAVPALGWADVPRPRGSRIYNYDLQLTAPVTGTVRTILRGKLMVTGDISHA